MKEMYLGLLKEYFVKSKEKFNLGNNSNYKSSLTYKERISKMNEITLRLREIENTIEL